MGCETRPGPEEPEYLKERDAAEDRAGETPKEKRAEESPEEDRRRERTLDAIIGNTFDH